MASNKDAAEVVKFLALLAKLKDECNDDPARIGTIAESNDAAKQLCNELSWSAHFLKMSERRGRELFTAPVDPRFVCEWRDFEKRFESVLLDISCGDLLQGLELVESTQTSRSDFLWEFADDLAKEQACAIERAIGFARDKASQNGRDFSGGFRESVDDGISAWERLKREVGVDPRGIFRRRELIPFVLVPRQVATRYGSETISLFNSLQHAHDAFIFGASFAALGLMRSILETALRDHYGIQGKNLEARIDKAVPFLPPGASLPALHRLRKLANAVLHLKERDETVPKVENAQMEKEIVSLLYVLRALIEGAPEERS